MTLWARAALIVSALAFSAGARGDSTPDFLPLVPGATYRYAGAFQGKSYDETILLKRATVEKADVVYFVEKASLEQKTVEIGSTMFGMGLYERDRTGVFTYAAMFLTDLPKVRASDRQLLFAVPAKPGARTTVSRRFLGIDLGATVTIVGLEDVRVPAGPFRGCLKIAVEEKGKTGYVWLAPGVGMVKWQRATGRIDELVSYMLPKR